MNKIKPIKRLGQNFLIDKYVIAKLIKGAKLVKSDLVLEIGPGMGILTEKLAKLVKKVIAVEKDPRLCKILKEKLRDYKNIEIINSDILKVAENRSQPIFGRERFSVIANLPFYITSPVIRKFLESKNPPKEMVLIIQKEVAQRICAKPPKMNLLAVSVQFYANAKILSYISKKSFWPQPKVDSAIIKITPSINCAKLSFAQRKKFFSVVKAGFSHPRKQLINNLPAQLPSKFQKLRAENLTIKDWIDLSKVL